MYVDENTTIGEILNQLNQDNGEQVASLLMQSGMHCLGCPSAQSETLGEACSVHGTDVNKLVDDINDILSKTND